MKKKKQPWLRLRHRIVTALLLWPFAIYTLVLTTKDGSFWW